MSKVVDLAAWLRGEPLPEEQVRGLVATHITSRQMGFLGEPRVNVLELNLAMDAQAAPRGRP